MTAFRGHYDGRYLLPLVTSTKTEEAFPKQDTQVGGSESTCLATYDRTPPGLSTDFHCEPHASVGEVAKVVYAEGGNLARILFPSKNSAKQGTSGGRLGKARGTRIKGFTGPARLRMREFTASIPRNLKALEFTLTYPQDYYVDPLTAKHEHLARFKKRLLRKYGIVAILWRMEFQGRPTPHFHLVAFTSSSLPVSKAKLAEIRTFVARSWWEACGKLSSEHLRAGTRVARVRSLTRTLRYLSKAEPLEEGPELSSPWGIRNPGRFWGVWGRDRLPIVWTKVRVCLRHAFRLRRHLRRLLNLKPRSAICTFRVFVGNGPVKRLLHLLGYPVARAPARCNPTTPFRPSSRRSALARQIDTLFRHAGKDRE
jgi:hypothetical protein